MPVRVGVLVRFTLLTALLSITAAVAADASGLSSGRSAADTPPVSASRTPVAPTSSARLASLQGAYERAFHLRRFNVGPAGFGTYNRDRGPQDGGAPQAVLGPPRRPPDHNAIERSLADSPATVGGDVASYRTATSRTYVTAAGLFVTRVYQAPVNYRDARGAWQPINDNLVRVRGGFANEADSYRAALPDDLMSPVRLASDVSLQLLGARANATVTGADATYKGAFPGVSLEYTAAPGRLKEAVRLDSLSAARPLTFLLRLGRGLAPAFAAGGELDVRDANGAVKLIMPPPFMYEQAKPAGGPGAVRTSLRRARSGWLLTLTPDRHWLEQPQRAWPVVIDPTTVYPGSIDEDCTIEGPPSDTTNFCNSTTNLVGTQGSPVQKIRTMFHFNVQGAVPADALVTKATMSETVVGEQNTQHNLDTQLFALSPHPFNRSATWDTYDGTHAWTTAGGDYDNLSPVNGTGDLVTLTPGSGTVTIAIAPWLVQDWLDGSSPNDGLIQTVEPSSESTAINVFQLASVLSTSNQPNMQVWWTPRLGAPRGVTIESTQLTDRTRMGVNVANGNLLINNNDLNIAGTGVSAAFGHTLNNLNPGWTYGAGPQPTLVPNSINGNVSSVTYFAPDGAPYVFTTPNGGGWNAPIGLDAALSTSNGTGCGGGMAYEATFQDNGVQDFDACGGIIDEKDNNSNTITYHRNTTSDDHIASETDTQGRTIGFSYCGSPATLCTVTDAAPSPNRNVSFSGSNPVVYTDAAGKQTQYFFNATGTLQKLVDPNGETTTFVYDSGNRLISYTRITNTTNGTGDTTSFVYKTPGTTIAALGSGCPAPIPTTDQPTPYPLYGQTSETDPNGHTTTYCYDTHDRVTATVDGRGHLWQTGYDLDDNVEKTLDPYGSTNGQVFNPMTSQGDRTCSGSEPASASGQNPATDMFSYPGATSPCNCPPTNTSCNTGTGYYPHTETDPQGNQWVYSYDGNNNLNQISTPLNNVVVDHNLSNHGLVDYTQDGNGNRTNYGYDSLGNLTSITPPLASPVPLGAISLSYDADSRVASQTDGKNQTTRYTYDPLDRISSIAYADGSTITYTYDGDGNVLQRIDSANGTSQYTYDLKNRLSKEVSPNVTNTYTYDGADNLASLTDGGGIVTYSHDAASNVSSVQEPGPTGSSTGEPNPITFTYDNANRRTCTLYPDGVVVLKTYDPAGHILSIRSYNNATACSVPTASGTTELDNHNYTYTKGINNDTDLRQTQSGYWGSTPQSGATLQNWTYSYDQLNRLTVASDANGSAGPWEYSYTYDGAGNITNWQGFSPNCPPNTCFSYNYSSAYNAANELTSGFTYDANGNDTTRGTQYNARNQTISAGGTPFSYLGASQSELTAADGSTYTNNVLGISSAFTPRSGTLLTNYTSYYTRDPSGELLGERVTGQVNATPKNYYYDRDANGTVDDVTAAPTGVGAATATGAASYDPYGNLVSGTAGAAPSDFGFDSGLPTNAGDKLGARFYGQNANRWSQLDPINQVADPVNSNRYVFAGDDPINQIDPSGLDQTSDWYDKWAERCAKYPWTAAHRWRNICVEVKGAGPHYDPADVVCSLGLAFLYGHRPFRKFLKPAGAACVGYSLYRLFSDILP